MIVKNLWRNEEDAHNFCVFVILNFGFWDCCCSL